MSDEQRCATCLFWDRDYLFGLGDHLVDKPGVCQRIVDEPGEVTLPVYLIATIEPVDGEHIGEIIRSSGIADDGTVMAAMLWTYADFGCVLWEARE